MLLCSKSSRINMKKMKQDWSIMFPEILELISDRLPLKDFIAFRSVCQHWRLAPSGRSNISKFSKGKPWLMFYGLTGDKCDFYCDSHPEHCTFYLPDLQGATIMESKFGWLIAHCGEHFFLYNCFSLKKINLPDHGLTADQVCTFTSLPTGSDCIVFIVTRKCNSHIEVSSCHIGDTSWEVEVVNASKDLVGTMLSVHCCTCISDETASCTCGFKKEIGIYGPEKYINYDYAVKKVTLKGTKTYTNTGEASWHEELKHKQKEIWLERFGGKGIKILTCAHSRREGIVVGINRHQRILIPKDGDSQSDDQLISLKTAPIELNFKEWVSIGSLAKV